MSNKIKTCNYCEINKELDYVVLGMNQSFGTMNDEQRARPMERIISIFNWDIIPTELQIFVTNWQEKIKDEKYHIPGLLIDKARINFGYGDRLYRINARTLCTDDTRLEFASEDILKELMEIGCNYGEYSGYLD